MSLIIKLIINVSHCSFMGDGCSQINVSFVVAVLTRSTALSPNDAGDAESLQSFHKSLLGRDPFSNTKQTLNVFSS